MNKIVEEIERSINDSSVIGVFGHQNADGDAVGSIMMMASFLRGLGKKVYVYTDTPFFPENLKFLNVEQNLDEDVDVQIDLAIALDTATFDRLGIYSTLFASAKNSINIDHHSDNTKYAKINYVIGGASSNCEILFDLLSQFCMFKNGIHLTKVECMYLLVGILTDSGRFKYSSTTANTFYVAGKLLELSGLNINDIITPLYDEISINKFNVNKLAFNNTIFYEGNKLAVTLITNSEYIDIGADYSYAKDVSQYILAVKSIIACAIISEDPKGNFHISFRSKGDVDISKCAAVFGGGGHKNASGCRLRGNPEEVRNKVLKALRNIL